jgi:hypothetical protein
MINKYDDNSKIDFIYSSLFKMYWNRNFFNKYIEFNIWLEYLNEIYNTL